MRISKSAISLQLRLNLTPVYVFLFSSYLANERKDSALDYKPPVPPHRNVGTRAMLPPQLPQAAPAKVAHYFGFLHRILLIHLSLSLVDRTRT